MGIRINTGRKVNPQGTSYNGLSWFDTSEAKKQRINAYNNYKIHYDKFFKQFQGGNKDAIYQDYLNLEWGDPLSVALDHDVGTDFFIYKNQLSKNPQYKSDFDLMTKFDTKDSSLIPKSFNLDNWAESLKSRATETQDYIHSLYNTRRAQRKIKKANRFAKRHGAPDLYLEFTNTHDIHFTPEKNSKFREGEVTVGMNGRFPFEQTISHEIAHGRELYNSNGLYKKPDSEYYGNNYDYIRNSHKRLLKPVNPINSHDSELSESYSDLMGLRTALHSAGIVDGTQRRYRNRDIKKYLNTDIGQKDRYLQYHPKINRVRKALNRIYNFGGKLENE